MHISKPSLENIDQAAVLCDTLICCVRGQFYKQCIVVPDYRLLQVSGVSKQNCASVAHVLLIFSVNLPESPLELIATRRQRQIYSSE